MVNKKVVKKKVATKSAEQAIKESLEAGDELATTVDEEGNEFTQRPISLEDIPEPEPVSGERVKVVSVYDAKQFLSGGETIGFREVKEILVSDRKRLGDRVVEAA